MINDQINDTVKNGIESIIKSENYETYPEIEVTQGSEDGDGYSSKSYAIAIKSESRKTLNLFVKFLPEKINPVIIDDATYGCRAEYGFYQKIYPAFQKFQEKKNIKEPFDNVPKHYAVSIDDCDRLPIFLENLRILGYKLRDRKKLVDDDHLRLPIQTFAKFHAISFALKDQEPEEFQNLSADILDIFATNFKKYGLDNMVAKCIDQFLDSLDPISDKKLLDRCSNIANTLIEHAVSIPQMADEYVVIGQGDCWSNNMMFLYDDQTDAPIDVKLLDWQCPRVGSPLLDFSYFFYTLATKEALDNAEHYLNLYYDTLTQRITELGSDPEKMYPYHIFMEHWRKFSLFGLTMAFFIVKVQLFEKDEVPDLMNSPNANVDGFAIVVKHQDKFISRIRAIVEYFVDKELV